MSRHMGEWERAQGVPRQAVIIPDLSRASTVWRPSRSLYPLYPAICKSFGTVTPSPVEQGVPSILGIQPLFPTPPGPSRHILSALELPAFEIFGLLLLYPLIPALSPPVVKFASTKLAQDRHSSRLSPFPACRLVPVTGSADPGRFLGRRASTRSRPSPRWASKCPSRVAELYWHLDPPPISVSIHPSATSAPPCLV